MTVMVKVIHLICCMCVWLGGHIQGVVHTAICIFVCVLKHKQWYKHSNVWLALNPHENWSVYNLTGEFPLAVSKPVIYPSHSGFVMCSQTHTHTHSEATHLMVALLMWAFWFLGHVQGWSVAPQCCWLFIYGMCSNVCTVNDMGAAFGLATQTANQNLEEGRRKILTHLYLFYPGLFYCVQFYLFFAILLCSI